MSKKDSSIKVFQREKIKSDLHIRERNDLTEKQKELLNLVENNDTKVVFIKGPAGVSKSYLAVLAGLRLLNDKKVSDIIYIRSIIESASKSLGSLPGDQNLKMEPFLMPLMDKLEELLSESQVKSLINDVRIHGVPVNYLRGASFAAKHIIVDEAQNMTIQEITTVITRLGEKSKLILLADPKQSDLNGRSGFVPMFNLFNCEESKKEGIFCFEFTKNDIVRSGILKYIVQKLEELSVSKNDYSPSQNK